MIAGGLPLTDPGNGGSLASAVSWVGSLLTGTLAAVIATIAIAGIGFLMLRGRLPLRRGLTIVIGCFIVSGATMIAQGLLGINARLSGSGAGQVQTGAVAATIPPSASPAQPDVYDPYAGASVPVR